MRMTYDVPGRGMFHTDCKKSGSGIMKNLHRTRDHEGTTLHAYECLHCGEIGYYGIQEKTRVIIVKSEADFMPKETKSYDEFMDKAGDLELDLSGVTNQALLDVQGLKNRVKELEDSEAGSEIQLDLAAKRIKDLVMITRMLMAKVQKTYPDSKVLKSAKAYLKKNDLEGSILRG